MPASTKILTTSAQDKVLTTSAQELTASASPKAAMGITHQWIGLRLIVGYLGEKAQQNWWPTSFYEPSSRLFLGPTFPRTFPQAQYYGVCEAARRLHDSRIGMGNAFHLFRLPTEMEQDGYHLLQNGMLTDGFVPPTDVSAALESLAELGHRSRDQLDTAPAGPHLVGAWTTPVTEATLAEFAGAYLRAFRDGTQVFPYLVA